MYFHLESWSESWRNQVNRIDHHRHLLKLMGGTDVIHPAQNEVFEYQNSVEYDRITSIITFGVLLCQLNQIQTATNNHNIGNGVLLHLLHGGTPTNSDEIEEAVDYCRLADHN